jgi:hypothetical protein
LALALFALAVLFMLLSVRSFRRSRKDTFWRRRRAAGQLGWRTFLLSAIFLVFSGALYAISVIAPRLLGAPAVGTVPAVSELTIAPTLDLTLTAIFASPAATTPPVTATSTEALAPTLAPTDTPTNAATNTATNTAIPATPPAQARGTRPGVASPAAVLASATSTGTLGEGQPATSATRTATALRPSSPTMTRTMTRTATLTATDTVTPSATASATPSPTRTASPTRTPSTTITPSTTPTPTLTPTITETLVPIYQPVAAISSVTPNANASMRITALDHQIENATAPANPTRQFSAGVRRIYFFVEFSGMTPGMLWRRELWRDGVLVQRSDYLWGQTPAGQAYFFFGQAGGFAAGAYEIRLYVGQASTPLAAASFTVT